MTVACNCLRILELKHHIGISHLLVQTARAYFMVLKPHGTAESAKRDFPNLYLGSICMVFSNKDKSLQQNKAWLNIHLL